MIGGLQSAIGACYGNVVAMRRHSIVKEKQNHTAYRYTVYGLGRLRRLIAVPFEVGKMFARALGIIALASSGWNHPYKICTPSLK